MQANLPPISAAAIVLKPITNTGTCVACEDTMVLVGMDATNADSEIPWITDINHSPLIVVDSAPQEGNLSRVYNRDFMYTTTKEIIPDLQQDSMWEVRNRNIKGQRLAPKVPVNIKALRKQRKVKNKLAAKAKRKARS